MLAKTPTRKAAIKGITILSAFLLSKASERIIEKKTNTIVPKEPDLENNQTWKQAIAYAAVTGAILGVFKLLVERTADHKIS